MKPVHEFKIKSSSWDFANEYNSSWGEGDLLSWPPRSYMCSFCKREFRSAQALGGHMNVHRRDRARLRQSPTPNALLNLNLDPNPSFNPNPSSFPSLFTKFPQFTSKLPPLGSPPRIQNCRPITTDFIKPKAAKALFGLEKLDEKGCEDLKRPESIRLDLEIGLVTQSKEELDLELRLGYT